MKKLTVSYQRTGIMELHMISLLSSDPLAFFIIVPIVLLSITVHEFAHCWVTDRLGDPTPRAKGRLTLNPLAHLDPLGTLMFLFTRFGWGKPAPFDPYNLKEPVRDTAIIAAAGPLSNILIAVAASILLKVGLLGSGLFAVVAVQVIILNLFLAVFNLIPAGPLDGAKIIVAVLPRQTALEFESFMERYGIFVLLLLIFPWSGGASPVSQLVTPVVSLLTSILL
jgi:Zn-dependent protease